MVRLGDDRVHMAYDMTWNDAALLHEQLGNALNRRKLFAVAIKKAKDYETRKTGGLDKKSSQ